MNTRVTFYVPNGPALFNGNPSALVQTIELNLSESAWPLTRQAVGLPHVDWAKLEQYRVYLWQFARALNLPPTTVNELVNSLASTISQRLYTKYPPDSEPFLEELVAAAAAVYEANNRDSDAAFGAAIVAAARAQLPKLSTRG